MKHLFYIAFFLVFASCGSSKEVVKEEQEQEPYPYQELKDENTFLLTEISDDDTYGYTPENPIMVGGAKHMMGPLNERRFLNALKAPNGKEITYTRSGSCCPFKSENGMINGTGMLDIFVLTWKGQELPVKLFLNMYDYAPLKAPKGFLIAK